MLALNPGTAARTPFRDDLRRLALADPLATHIAALSSLVAYWRGNDTSGLVDVVVNPAVSEGRELVINGDGSTTTGWSALNSATLSSVSGWLRIARNGTNSPSATQNFMVAGKIYHVQFDARSDGSAVPQSQIPGVGTFWTGTTSTSTQHLETWVIPTASGNFLIGATAAATGTQYVEFDNITVKQVGIPASSSFPTLELVKNGGFDWDVAWTKGTGWTISGGVATHAAGSSGGLQQALPIIIGRQYDITYTVSGRTAGSIQGFVGSGSSATSNSSNGVFTETLTCAGSTNLSMSATSTFDGSIDNVSVVPHDAQILWDGLNTAANWSAINSAILTNPSAGVLRTAYNGVASPFARQIVLKTGSTYRMLVTATPSGASITALIRQSGTNVLSQTISVATPLEVVFIATGTTVDLGISGGSAGQYMDWSTLTFTEIAPMSGVNLNGVTLNQSTGNSLTDPVYSLDGVNDGVNIYSADLNSALPLGSRSVAVYANWISGNSEFLLKIGNNAQDFVQINVNASGNLSANVTVNSVGNALTGPAMPPGNHMVHLTIDTASGIATLYLDGVVVASASGVAAGVSNLGTNNCAIGVSNSSGANNPFNGKLGHVAAFNVALAPDEVLLQAGLAGVA